MPWKETCTMQEREDFISAWLSRAFCTRELCRRFNISPRTAYKWINRFKAEGMSGLADRSRARLTQAGRTPENVVRRILELKYQYPGWGPVTIHSALIRQCPEDDWPVPSTIGSILNRHGLVKRRRPRKKVPPHTQPLAHAEAPNDVWSADYKGQFRLGDGRWCYPLTITDNASRLLISCKGLYGPQLGPTKQAYIQAFRDYGLPKAIRTDNGWPFAMTALGGLSPLAIWLIRLGIFPERIEPGCPQQNGRHERMHRTLKAAAISPPKGNMSAQQRAFNRFRHEHNEVKPHQGLDVGLCPVDRYSASPRQYQERLPELEYPGGYEVRKVRCGGYIRLHGASIYTTRQLVGEYIGLEPLDHDRWQLYFGMLKLGVVDERLGRVIRPT